VHLYNVEEAMMSQIIELVGTAVGAAEPRRWNEATLKEWLRAHAINGEANGEETRLSAVHRVTVQLLKNSPIGSRKLKKPKGTWTDKSILEFANRLQINIQFDPAMHRRLAKQAKYGDRTPLRFLADKRNALAHGDLSFEEGARELTLADLRELSDVTLDFLSVVIGFFQNFVDETRYLNAAVA
jgi:hypothetical protein